MTLSSSKSKAEQPATSINVMPALVRPLSDVSLSTVDAPSNDATPKPKELTHVETASTTNVSLQQQAKGTTETTDTPTTQSSPPSEKDSPTMSDARKTLIALGMGLTYFIGTAASSSVTLLIPDIARGLNVSELEAQWVVSAYSLAFGCGLLFAGRLADLYGRKRLYIGGLSAFCLFSILSAVVNNRIGICVLRAMCGLGLAVADPAGFGIVAMAFRKEPGRTIAFAAFGLGAALGVGAGTMIGAVMVATGSRGWSYLFYLLGGLAVIPIVIGVLVVPKDSHIERLDEDRRIDWFGGLIVTTGLCLFCFSLTESGTSKDGWSKPYVPALFVVSLVLLVLFATWERYLERNTTLPPVVKLSLFTRHKYRVTIVIVSTFFVYMNAHGYMYLVTIWFQTYMGMTALESGLRMLPCMIVGAIASMSTMWLGTRVRAPLLIVVGCLLGSIATLLFAVVPVETDYWAYQFISLILVPWGTNFMVCLGNVMISNLVEQDEQSVGGAIFQTSIQIGASIGTCLVSLVSTTRAEDTGDLVRGLRDTFWMITSFSWLAVILIIGLGLRRVGLARDIRGEAEIPAKLIT